MSRQFFCVLTVWMSGFQTVCCAAGPACAACSSMLRSPVSEPSWEEFQPRNPDTHFLSLPFHLNLHFVFVNFVRIERKNLVENNWIAVVVFLKIVCGVEHGAAVRGRSANPGRMRTRPSAAPNLVLLPNISDSFECTTIHCIADIFVYLCICYGRFKMLTLEDQIALVKCSIG